MCYNQVMDKEVNNSLTDLAVGVVTQQNQISQASTIDLNLRRYMITNNRDLLSSLYVELGIVQTLIDQPVIDAFNKLPIITSGQLEPEEIEEVNQFIEQKKWFNEFKQAAKWGRLFGGAGLVINTPQNPTSELRIDLLNKNSNVKIYAADRWELNYQPNGEISGKAMDTDTPISKTPYNYYGITLNNSRVLRFVGKQAPSILRLQLMGWGMSEIERLIRSMNSFLKNQDVVFELLDEAKVDVYQLDGFNSALIDVEGTNKIQKQVQIANMIKSYLNALVLDKDDVYNQKQLSFSGLPDMLREIRQAICADLRMPEDVLWGASPSGLSNNNETGRRNYNLMLEDVRTALKPNYITLWKIACQLIHGFIPDDLDWELPALESLSAEQTENVKDKQFNRLLTAFQAQLISSNEFYEACNKNNLLPIEIGADNGKEEI